MAASAPALSVAAQATAPQPGRPFQKSCNAGPSTTLSAQNGGSKWWGPHRLAWFEGRGSKFVLRRSHRTQCVDLFPNPTVGFLQAVAERARGLPADLLADQTVVGVPAPHT